MIRFIPVLFVLTISASLFAEDKTVYRIGIPKTLFRDLPPAMVAFAGAPFSELMKDQTGLKAEVAQDDLPMTVAKGIDEGKYQLGVFQGHEFAWAREKYPKFQAIVCTVYRPKDVQALILVKADSKAVNLGDFKDRRVAMAKALKDHVPLFLEKCKTRELRGGKFSETIETANVHEAIQKVMDNEAEVTIADFADWSYFQKLYPGPSQNIKVLSKSELFPPTVLVFKTGTIDDATVRKIRDGFLTAHETSKGVRMMKLMRLDRFDTPPADFEESVKRTLKAYPFK